MRRWVVIVVVVVLVLLAAVAAGGWWYVKKHERIGQGDLVSEVKKQENAGSATCVKLDSNAEHWLCAVSGSGQAKPKCVRAHVRPWGAVELKDGFRRCQAEPQLKSLFPSTTGGGGGSTQG
jgi:uncharacterized membrane protein